MTKASVLSSITFWSPGAWTPRLDLPLVTLSIQDQLEFESTVTDTVGRLYDGSPELVTILENLSSAQALRIGTSLDTPGAQTPAIPQYGSDAYLVFSPNIHVYSIDNNGNLFQINEDIVLAHELGHTSGLHDPARDVQYTDSNGISHSYSSDSFMNSAHSITAAWPSNYAYTPDIVQFENTVANELGIAEHRVSYDAAFRTGDARYNEVQSIISSQGSLTDGRHIDVIRFGDQDGAAINNNMDFTGWSTSPGVLAFGMTGDDTMKAGDGNAYFYGDAGQDSLVGGAGDDRLHGGDGADVIDGKGGSNYLFGDGGDDRILTHGALDFIDGGTGNDVINTYGSSGGNPPGSSSIHFEDGRGVDVVEMRANSITVLDLSKYTLDDITIVAGGEDVYGSGDYSTDYTQFEFLTFIMPGGDKITFTDDLMSVGPSTAADWSKIGTYYAADHLGPLSVQFADGNSLTASALWNYINDLVDHSNVAIDLFGVYGAQSYDNVPFTSMDGANYLAHINSDYFIPDNIV